jgi:hypothetical protein
MHSFISEECDENLFLIDLINDEQSMKDEGDKVIKKRIAEAKEGVKLTDSTIKVLEDRKEKTYETINSFKKQLENVKL